MQQHITLESSANEVAEIGLRSTSIYVSYSLKRIMLKREPIENTIKMNGYSYKLYYTFKKNGNAIDIILDMEIFESTNKVAYYLYIFTNNEVSKIANMFFDS